MSAPTGIANTQNSALHALQQHKPHGGSAASNAPSQLQQSFANLISSLNGTGATQSTGSALQVSAVGGVSPTNSLDMASLIEALQSSSAAALPDLNQSGSATAHPHHHAMHQAGGVTDAGSSSAVSAYSAMAAPASASASAGVSTRV